MHKQIQEANAAQDELDARDWAMQNTIGQLRQAAADTGLFIAPLPDTFEGWSPLLIPPEKRCDLIVCCSFEAASPEELRAVICRTTGLTCEFAPGVFSDENCSSVILQVMQMDAKLWLDWISKIMNATYTLDARFSKNSCFVPAPVYSSGQVDTYLSR